MSPRRSPHLPWLLALLLALAPASARAAAEEGRITWSGAALAAVQAPDARREDGRPALEDTRFVLMRAALGAHAHLGDAWTLEARVASDRADALDGSPRTPVTLERCELAWARSPRMTWRIGRLPVPVGDPDEPLAPGGAPGIARPDVEQLVIPAPWSAYGLAATGVLGHRASWTLATLQALDADVLDLKRLDSPGQLDHHQTSHHRSCQDQKGPHQVVGHKA